MNGYFYPSVCHTFWLYSHHRIIMKFSGVITNNQSEVHAKGQCQRSKFKVTEVKTQLNRFRTVTPIWIHIWWWNEGQSLMLLRRGALLFLKVIRQISRSHGKKIADFHSNWAFPDCNLRLNLPMGFKWCTKLNVSQKRCPIVFQGHPSSFKVARDTKIADFDLNWACPDCNSSLNSQMDLKW